MNNTMSSGEIMLDCDQIGVILVVTFVCGLIMAICSIGMACRATSVMNMIEDGTTALKKERDELKRVARVTNRAPATPPNSPDLDYDNYLPPLVGNNGVAEPVDVQGIIDDIRGAAALPLPADDHCEVEMEPLRTEYENMHHYENVPDNNRGAGTYVKVKRPADRGVHHDCCRARNVSKK